MVVKLCEYFCLPIGHHRLLQLLLAECYIQHICVLIGVYQLTTYNQPENKASCRYGLVDAIRAC